MVIARKPNYYLLSKLVVILVSQLVSAQKQPFYVTAGLAYRITPVYLNPDDSGPAVLPIFVNQDDQLTGPSLNVTANYLLVKHQILVMSGIYGRIDHHYYNDNGTSINEEKKSFISDFTIGASKLFSTKKGKHLVIGVGYNFMNNGTGYSYKRVIGYDSTGAPLYANAHNNLSFKAISLGMGYKSRKLQFDLTTYLTEREVYDDPSALLLFELKASYIIQFQ